MQHNTQTVQDIEQQKLTLMTGLSQVARSLRTAAELTEGFVSVLAQSPFAPHPMASPNIYTNMLLEASNRFQMNEGQMVPSGKRGPTSPAEDDDGKKKRKKTEKKPKDPNAPKRPPSAYLLFQNEVRKEMQLLHSDKPYHEVLSAISKRWAAMTDEEKLIYTQATTEAKDRYNANKAAYDSQLTSENGVPPTVRKAVPAPSSPVVEAAPTVAPVPKTAKAEEVVVASDESSEEEDSDSSSEDDDEEEDPQPPTKKAKTQPKAPAPVSKPKQKETKKKEAKA